MQIPEGFSWRVTYWGCATSVPFPFPNVQNVNLVERVNSTLSLTSAQDNGGPLLGGSFRLSMDNVTWTPPLLVNVTATALSNALNALPGISSTFVMIDVGSSLVNVPFRIAFQSPNRDYPLLLVDGSRLTGINATATVGSVENASTTDLLLDPIPGDFFQVCHHDGVCRYLCHGCVGCNPGTVVPSAGSCSVVRCP